MFDRAINEFPNFASYKKQNIMKNNLMTPRFIVLAGIVIFGAFMRFVPHWPNFTPIAAMALFGGAYFSKKYLAFAIPLIAMFISDLLIGLHSSMIAVYVAFAITVMIGFAIRSKISLVSVAGASILSTIIFFLITNFASWLAIPYYTKDFAGLMQAYAAGLAFFNNGSMGISFFMNSLLAGLFYNGLFFGAFYLVRQKFPSLARA